MEKRKTDVFDDRLFIIKLAHSDHGVDNLLRFVGHTIAQSFIVLEE